MLADTFCASFAIRIKSDMYCPRFIFCFTKCFTASKFKHELMFLSMFKQNIYPPGVGRGEKSGGRFLDANGDLSLNK